VRDGAAGADLLIHEAMYFPEGSGHYRSHSHPKRVGEIAKQAEVKKLILTHLQPGVDQERLLNDASAFTQSIVAAADRMRLSV
jgi:ribonuclease BN (tRNA processing enzyme)